LIGRQAICYSNLPLVVAKLRTKLKKGDKVKVISGGSKKVPIKGRIGKILSFVESGQRLKVIVDGVNVRVKTIKPLRPGESARLVRKEMPIDISNVMYYAETLGKPVRLRYKIVDSKKIRGYIDPNTKEFVQV